MLLDTCTLLWLTSATDALSKRACAEIAKQPARLRLSSISAFEIGQKVARGKLILPLDLATWWQRVIEQHGLVEMPVTGTIAATATMLPLLHRDPFDRLLVATAIVHELPILTPDPHIRQYSDIKTIW